MTDRTQCLLREALSLSDGERADLAAELLMSLYEPADHDPTDVQQLWSQEIQRRARRVLAVESPGEAWEQVRDHVGRRLTNG